MIARVRLVPHYRGGRLEVVLAHVDRCPLCGQPHVHGAGRDLGAPDLGHRVAHCRSGGGGYRLEVAS